MRKPATSISPLDSLQKRTYQKTIALSSTMVLCKSGYYQIKEMRACFFQQKQKQLRPSN